MIIGTLQFELLIHDAESLKDKRRVVKSLKDRLHREHLVSIAETAALDNPARAVMGLAVVGAEGKRIAATLDRVTAKLLALTDAELGACTRELIHGSAQDDDAVTEEPALEDIDAELLRYAQSLAQPEARHEAEPDAQRETDR